MLTKAMINVCLVNKYIVPVLFFIEVQRVYEYGKLDKQ